MYFIIMLPGLNFEGRCRKPITAPTVLTKSLAEEIGIHIGDGCLCLRKKAGHYDYFVCLHRDEEDYKDYVIALIRHLYGIAPSHVDKDEIEKSVALEYNSRMLFEFKKMLGLPIGNKKDVVIPEFVEDSEFVLDCVRGIFDMDGSLTFKKKYRNRHYYPVIKIDNKNPALILQVERILLSVGIKSFTQLDRPMLASNGSLSNMSTVFISGKKRLEKFLYIVSPKNENHISKYRIWKKFGFCPPKTTLEERRKILQGTLNPENFYAGGGI